MSKTGSLQNIITDRVYPFFLSQKRKEQFERIILLAAIIAFIIHFLAIILVKTGIITESVYGIREGGLNPIMAIYTPFSIILLYEIYLLIYYLSKSITIYIGKQYEIIAIIFIRRVFEDLGTFSTRANSADLSSLTGLLITFAGLIILSLLIFCFYKLSGNKQTRGDDKKCGDKKYKIFVIEKELLSLILFFLFVYLFISSFFQIRNMESYTISDFIYLLKTMNFYFFDVFFTALILLEVLLLLFTFQLSDRFCKIMRNSGFIISTILLKLSFRTQGLMNIALILTAVAFGVIILWVYKLFERKIISGEDA